MKAHAEILIVEGSSTQTLMLRRTLEQKGFGVRAAREGTEALALLEQAEPSLIITAIEMPGMGGYQLCQKLKSDRRFAGIPVMLLTSLSNPEDVTKGLECGADDVLTKPYQTESLLSRIESILANEELREKLPASSGELRQARETGDEANSAKGDSLANMSHEICTPMGDIINMVECVLNGDLSAEQRERLEIIKVSAESLLARLNGALDSSKVDAADALVCDSRNDATEAPEEGSCPAPASSPRERKLHILLAEDSRVNQLVATRMLEKNGHSVVLAENGVEAVAALAKESFDLILMDVEMPEMDGLEATALIREKERETGGRICILAMTAHSLKEDLERFIQAGMDGQLSKPLELQEFLQTVDEVTGRCC